MNFKVNQLVETSVDVEVEGRRGRKRMRSFGIKLRPGVVYGPCPEELVERLVAFELGEATDFDAEAPLPLPLVAQEALSAEG